MVFPILPANTLSGGYDIDNSLRFNQGDSPSLTKTFDSAGTEETFTWSGWVKRGADFGTRQVFFGADNAEDSGASYVRFTDDETIQAFLDDGNTLESNLNTSAKFRDVSAWYHIVWAVDTTQSTDTNRVKLYVNGVQITAFQSPVYPPQNFVTDINAASEPHYIGTPTAGVGNDYALDGYMSDVYFIDGTQYAASDFGETDADSGIWKPKSADVTFGTNGFFLEFQQVGTSQDSSGIGADTSGQDNHFAVANLAAVDITTDTPTNNFCTFNPLDNAVLVLAEGNTKASHADSGGGEENRGTMGFANGKWYWEFQIGYVVNTNRVQPFGVGLCTNTGRNPLESDIKTTEAYTVHWYTDTSNNSIIEKVYNTGTTVTASEAYPDNGDIVQFAIDADAGKVWVGKNNTWLDDASGNVGDPAGGNYPIHSYTVVTGDFIFPAILNMGSQGLTILLNTGNPAFAISSGNADGNGYGNFEHAPPSGFYSICSKNLAEYG